MHACQCQVVTVWQSFATLPYMQVFCSLFVFCILAHVITLRFIKWLLGIAILQIFCTGVNRKALAVGNLLPCAEDHHHLHTPTHPPALPRSRPPSLMLLPPCLGWSHPPDGHALATIATSLLIAPLQQTQSAIECTAG